ncbi:cilia- and flagella-associated protein 221 isoform X2 [Eleutherodactylus coqui]|uniref:cilia- and flagella-associated protein 221 isoform X2 n=1 Tax=Eleutherodactylus coqui TaxID=57060 RepID=UPI003462FA41
MEVAPPAKFNFPKGDRRLQKALSSSSSVFLDSLVEKPLIRPVPNHLLESKVYRKLGSNVSVAADPEVLHFGGFEIGRCHRQVVNLVNISSDVSNVHVIPPQSKHFTISYKKANRLPPGFALTLSVQFMADEWRYYYDCIRVHCKGDETLLVPLHAYPVMDLLDFPSHVNLSEVPLGQSSHYVLPLRCSCPVDFAFSITCPQPHKDFDISPASGIIPGGEAVEVTVTYNPSSYGTAQIRLELLISEFNAKPRICVITGTCTPRLTAKKEQPEDVQISSKGGLQAKSYIVSRKKRHLQSLQQNASQVIEFHNLRFPINLSSPHAVSTVLNQQPGKLRVRDLREGLTGSDKKRKTRQEKETQFQQVIQQNVAEEETNQLRWQVHLGCDAISAEQRHVIMEDRQSAEAEYQIMRGRPDLAAEYSREAVLVGCRRVLRSVGECPPMQPQFDLYLNDLWANRQRALRRFQQAARKVLIRGRVNGRLRSLTKLLQRLRSEQEGGATCESSDQEVAPLSAQQVLFYEFPPYPADPDGSMVEDLVSLPPKPAAAQLRQTLSFQDLKVPQHFRLMAYQPVRSHGASSMYQSQHLARPLRKGAENELLPELTLQPDISGSGLSQALSIRSQGELEEERAGSQTPLLRPPKNLLMPPDFHPMHVFNPAPGLLAFKRPLPYSEIDLEYHLCPLPKYTTQQGGAARKEIVRGVMSWKKFPAVSLSMPLATSDGCKPRRCDPFSEDLLPVSAPPALSSLPVQDKENIVPRDRDDADSKVCLTLDMLRAEFSALQSSAEHDKRDTCEQRVESSVPAEGSSLVDKVQGNLKQMRLLSHHKWLILD